MTITYTSLLGLTKPDTGTQSGTWGSDLNTGLTDYLDAAVAGAQVISGSQTAVTLSVTTGTSGAPSALSQAGSGATGSSQYQIIRCTGNPAGLLTITAPASDKTYVILNATSTSQSVKIVGAGPTTGVTIVSGERAFVAWNGSDFVKVGGAAGGTNTQVQYNNGGVFGGVSGATTNGTAITFSTTNLKLQGSSTGVSSFASANSSATDYTVTFPAASTTIPVATQTLTFSGPTAARTITLPDANFTAARTDSAQTFTGVQTFSSNPILSGGTANGVLYLNGSSVATSGGALTFDGTTFQYTGAANFATSSGNVGIGTASPPSKLGVYAATGGSTTGLTVNASGNMLNLFGSSSTSAGIILNATDGTVGSATAVPMIFRGGGTEFMRLDTSGNLGIGTGSPQSGGITVFAGTAVAATTPGVMTLGPNSTTVASGEVIGRVQFYSNDASTNMAGVVGKIDCIATGNFSGTAPTALTFHTNDSVAGTITERARITSGGALLVGDTTVGSGSDRLGIVGGNIRVIKSTAYAANPLDATSFSGAILVNSNNGSGDLTGLAMYVDSSYTAGCGIFAKQTASTTADLLFYTGTGVAASNVERARITSGGNLTVGSTSAGNAGTINVSVGSPGTTAGGLQLWASTSQTHVVQFGDGTSGTDPFRGYIEYSHSDDSMRFGTTSTERARINSDGYLLVGYTASNGAYKLQVNSQIFATSATIATSDGRYKENVTSLTGALDIVKALNPVQFTWRQHPIHNFDRSCPTVGFIAQEVQQVLADKPYLNSIIKKNECEIEPAQYETVVLNPAVDEVKDDEGNIIVEAKEAVTEQRLLKEAVKEDFYGIAEGNMIAILTKALQESTARIEQLEAKVAVLEGTQP